MIAGMLQSGILNPHVLQLIARIRHTNTLVIADWAFPFWPKIETVDISLTQGIPTVLDVLDLLTPVFKIGRIWQADEFLATNPQETVNAFAKSFGKIPLTREPQGLHAWKVIIEPERGEPKMRIHDGYEWLYVLSGTLRLMLAGHDVTMKPGEVAEFDTALPHWFGPADDQPVEILSVLSRKGEQMHLRAAPRRKRHDQ